MNGSRRIGDTVECPICRGRHRLERGLDGVGLEIACDGRGPQKPVAFDWHALIVLGGLMVAALLVIGSCVHRAHARALCPPVTCPRVGEPCPSGCACVPRAPGDSVGVCR